MITHAQQLLLALFSLLSVVLVAQSNQCSQTVLISSNSSCVWSNESGGKCGSLSDILNSRRDIANGECVEFAFNAGNYYLPTNNITITYSAMMKAVSGIVNITSSNTTDKLPTPANFSYLIGFSGSMQTNITIDGIHFNHCSGPLRFTNLAHLSIINSNFSNFVAQPTDILNCRHVEVINCRFYNSNASTPNDQYRGNSGGLTIGYRSDISDCLSENPTVTVSNCRFSRNRSLFPTQRLSNNDINFALNNRYYFARGGGFGLILDDNYCNITATISNCTFDSNYAMAFGGGIYIILNGKGTHHNISVVGCTFYNNFSSRFGGGLLAAFLLANDRSIPSQLKVNNCSFVNNQAQYGGGISTNQFYNLGQGNMVQIKNSIFIGNQALITGSSVIFTSFEYTQIRNTILPYLIQNCDFQNNTSPVGVIAAVFQNFIMNGHVNIINNFGPGLRIIGALVHVNGSITLVNNSASGHVGGALYISSFGQLKLYQGSEMKFINNTGMIGAAIVVDVQKSSKIFSHLVKNPQCFLTFDNITSSPLDYKGTTVTIIGNTAAVGPAVYISHLDLCAWVFNNNSVPIFDSTYFPKWAIFNIRNNTSTAHQNATSPQFYIQTGAARIESLNNSGPFGLSAGTYASWSLIGRDQFENPTYFIAGFSDSRDLYTQPFTQASAELNTTSNGLLVFDPALVPILPTASMYGSVFDIFNITPKTYKFGDTVPIRLNTPYNILYIPSTNIYNFSMTVDPCYPGYELKLSQSNRYHCSCVDSNPDIICDQTSNNLFVRNGQWAGASYQVDAYIQTYICPASYCLCKTGKGNSCIGVFSQNDTKNSKQCHPTRKGILCGQCINGTAVGILRQNCRTCEHEAFYALPLIVIWDIALTLLIILVSLRVSASFAPGLKGLLFYIQTVYYATEFFPASFWDARQYMLYISSALSLYFPWDFCLYPGATSLQMSAVQFLTPATVLTVTVVTLIVIKRSHLRKTWHGILTLILLLYPSLVHNCMSLLHCPTLPDNTTSQGSMRWFVDGTVNCYGDWGHTLLAVTAILVLALLAAWIPLICVLTICDRIHNKSDQEKHLDNVVEALKAGYKKNYEWWIGVEFLRQFVLIAFLVFYPGRTVIPIYILLFATTGHTFFMPYTKWWQNLIEVAILAHFIAILLLRSTQSVVTYLSTFPGTSIPDSQGTRLAEPDKLTQFFSAILYVPLIAALPVGVAWVIFRGIIHRRSRSTKTETKNELDDFSRRYSQGRNSTELYFKPFFEDAVDQRISYSS